MGNGARLRHPARPTAWRLRGAAAGLACALLCALLGGCAGPLLAPGIPAPAATLPFIKAVTDVAYSPTVFCSQASDNELAAIRGTGATWVVLGVVWAQVDLSSTTIRPWIKTTSDACLLHAIRRAQALGLSVALKPLDNPENNAWQALIAPTDWAAWFASYTRFVDHYATIARTAHAQLLIVGGEFDSSDTTHTAQWEAVIASVRRIYPGPLTYGADWTQYQQIGFWRDLNYVGIDAYFPLASSGNPTQAQASAAWTPWLREIAAWRQRAGLTAEPVLFTEIGYLSRSGAAENPAGYVGAAPVDLPLQATLFAATLSRLFQVPWLGGILWFWWDNPSTADYGGGADNAGYTPDGKPALQVLTSWYQRDWNTAARRASAGSAS